MVLGYAYILVSPIKYLEMHIYSRGLQLLCFYIFSLSGGHKSHFEAQLSMRLLQLNCQKKKKKKNAMNFYCCWLSSLLC